MNFKKSAASIGLAVAAMCGLVAPAAQAGVTFYTPATTFEDDNLDFFFDAPGSVATGSQFANVTGRIDVGDRLVSVLEIGKTANPFVTGQTSSITGGELTGIIDAIVLAKVPLGGGLFTFVFGPNLSSPYMNGAAGEIVKAYFDSTPDFDAVGNSNCVNFADCVARATDGADFLTLGFSGTDADEFFGLRGTDLPSIVKAGQPGAALVPAVFAFSILANNTGQTFGQVACVPNSMTVQVPCDPFGVPGTGDGFVDLAGSGSVLGGSGLTNDAFGRSDFDFDVTVLKVPEPSALALVGLALVGLGLSRRRSQT